MSIPPEPLVPFAAPQAAHNGSIRLQDLADLLKTLDENALVAITDANGCINHVNDLFCRVSKYAASELIGQNHRILNSGCHGEAHWRNLWTTILSGNVWKGEVKNRAKDGTFYWVQATIAPAFDNRGRIKHFLAIYTEISPQKEAEENLRQTQRLDSLRVMAGGIAHDFNNLLTSILGNCGLLTMNFGQASQALPLVENIEKSVQRATLLTSQLLAFTGSGPWQPIRVELSTFVREMEAVLRNPSPQGPVVRLDLAPIPLFIKADPSQLHQAIISLTNNAVEAIAVPEEGAVTIRVLERTLEAGDISRFMPQTQMKAGRYGVLEVDDTGCGMTPEVLSRVFDPFFTTKFTGRGLGLSALVGILRAMGGGISVDTRPRQGSTFRIYLPLAEEEPVQEPIVHRATGRDHGTVLFVDDEPMLREVAAEVLASTGFDVLLAGDGVEAVALYQRRPETIALVVMDLTMPRLGGLEAANRIRTLNPKAKVILSSGYSDQVMVGSMGNMRPDAFLQKPYKLDDLLEMVRMVASAGN